MPGAGGCVGGGCGWLPGSGRQREVAPHPALRGHLPPRGKAGVVGEGFIPPGVFAAAQAPAGRRGRRPLRVARERAAAGGRGGVGAPRPTDGVYVSAVGATRAAVPGPPCGRGRACPARRVAWAEVCGWFVGRGLDPSAGDCPGIGSGASLPLIRPCGATFPQGGRQGVVGEGFIPPGVFAAARIPAGRRGRRPLRFAREHVEMQRVHILTPAAGPRCGAGGSGCSTSGPTKPALYRCNPGRCRGGSRR